MWPFSKKQKLIKAPAYDVSTQLGVLLKSVSLPESVPRWKLLSTSDTWSTDTAINEGYNAVTMVYACVEKNAKLTSAIPWKAQRRVNDEWVDAPDSPLQRLIDKPNSDQSWRELMYYTSQNLDLAGNNYFSEIKAGINGFPVELWILSPEGMEIARSSVRLVDYYKLPYINGSKIIEAEDMIHLRLPNPNSQVFGQPVLMAAGKPADIDREAGDFQKVSYQNRGLSDVHIEVPEGTTQEQINAVKKSYKEKQSGPKSAREPIVSSGKINALNQSAVEMDFVNSRRSVWIEICAAFGQSLSVHGMTENVNLANGQEQNKQLYQNTILPRMDLIQDQFNRQLSSEFGPDYRMVYDTTNVKALQEDEDKKLERAQKMADLGIPLNVINQKLELGLDTDSIEGSDMGYISAGKIPVGMSFAEETEEEKALIAKMAYGTKDA